MNKGRLEGYMPLGVCILIALLAVTDYFLFREYELVWPFFLLPYLFFSILFWIEHIRSGHRDFFSIAVFQLVIIPVFAGLTMSLGWMIKIDFLGEMIRLLAD